jgi:hypothetical protein
MPDTIGNISVPSFPASGLTFPLVSEFGYAASRPFPVVSHRFGGLATKGTQVFQTGFGPRKFAFKRTNLSITDTNTLENFFEGVQGAFQSFAYDAPQPASASTSAYQVVFENTPLTFERLITACRVGFNFLEVPSGSGSSYTGTAVCTRFPTTSMNSALLGQVQQIVPLLHIRVRDSTVPDIWLSDRRTTLSGSSGIQSAMGWASTSQLYLPRILELGEKGTDYIMSQTISTAGGKADDVSFALGNGDRVMTQLSNSCDLMYASVDLCLYHVQSETLLQLWKGFIQSYQSDGTAVFRIKCSDGMYPVYQLYPNRVVSRFCQNTFNDGITCPYSTVTRPTDIPMSDGTRKTTYTSTAGTTTVGTANPDLCSYLYDDPYDPDNPTISPGGCCQHAMYQYFGGHPLNPQSVQIHDFGNHHDLVTSTSIVSDTVTGQPLPEIWCNQQASGLNAYVTNGLMYDIRDESTFLDGGAIIGAGPLGAYTIVDRVGTQPNGPFTAGNSGEVITNSDGLQILVAPTLDGFPAQGFKESISGSGNITYKSNSNAGLRQVFGYTPIPSTDEGYNQFGLTQTNNPGSSGSTVYNATSPSNNPTQFAAGTAFVEIRIPKNPNPGITPSVPESHSISVQIAQGLAGWTWDYTGTTRTSQIGLTNPFWIAVNSYLRCLSLNGASSSAQLAMINLASLVNNESYTDQYGNSHTGSGAAQIADLSVPALVGSGDETQFQFQGVIGADTQKPLRDWLTEILNCALGYYTFEFGQLTLGIRINANDTTAFTVGNMLYQSLTLTPIQAAFEKLVINFADVEYQYQQNQGYYFDRDHANFYGRGNNPLQAKINSLGISTMSQALRVATTRVREETGGVGQQEWAAARVATFETTILALDTEVGQVISITHPDCPGGYNPDTWVPGTGGTWVNGTSWFRIQSWRLKKDWSIEITAKTVTPSMYDLDYGPRPKDVPPPPLRVLFYPQPQGQWAPGQIQAASNDALYPSEYTFDLQESYTPNADNSATATLQLTGAQPVNVAIPNCAPPTITSAAIAYSSTGGTIPGGILLKISVCGANAQGQLTPPSNIVLAQIPTGSNTNSFTLSNIIWPGFAGLTGYILFASTADDLICEQTYGALTPGTPDTTYTPTSISCGSYIRTGYALPDPTIAGVRPKGSYLWHGGVLGAVVYSVSTDTIVSPETIDTSGHDDWAGRVLAIIGRPSASIPFASFNITAFDAATGTYTLDRDPTGIVDEGDVFVVCTLGYDNSSAPAVLTDSGWSNATNVSEGFPSGGMVPGQEVGRVCRVIKGTNRGMTAKIISNTHTSITLDSAFPIDATSVYVIQDASWAYSANALSINNAIQTTETTLTLPVANAIYESMLVGGFTVSNQGVEVSDFDTPLRMVYVFGNGGLIQRTIGANGSQELDDGFIQIDASAGNVSLQCLSAKTIPGRRLIVQKIDSTTNLGKILPFAGETINGQTEIDLSAQWDTAEIYFIG